MNSLFRVAFMLALLHTGLFAAAKPEPFYRQMDFGPSLNWTYQVGKDHIVYKGTAVQVDDAPGGIGKGSAWMVFDHDTLSMAAAWVSTEETKARPFIDWKGVAFDGSHNSHPRISGKTAFVNAPGPGYANPANGSFDDPRYVSPVDTKRYGPIPREWGHFQGLYRTGNKVVIAYSIGGTAVLEMPGFDKAATVFSRTFYIESIKQPLTMRVAPDATAVALSGLPNATLEKSGGVWLLRLPVSAQPLRFKILLGDGTPESVSTVAKDAKVEAIETLRGGTRSWSEPVVTTISNGESTGGFASDTLTLPDKNPWNSLMRAGGFDFFPEGKRAAVCTWNGDVWLVDGVDGAANGELKWQRIASGLFQPLGLKIVNGKIYVCCRDQIVRLNDLNGDGEIDFYENFNNDHQVTEHFHEFAMGLQTDKQGNFYYAKSARHALPGLIPQHGTLMRVSADGLKSTIVATGFRAANGVCVNDDGTFYVTDQEGHWTPKNRINLVKEGGFYGNMNTLQPKTQSADDSAMSQPMVWMTNVWDRSPGELVRVDSPSWGPLNGKLLDVSYGPAQIFLVLQENVGEVQQGGVVPLPLRFPTGTMRGRFHPSGNFYVCGLVGWSSNVTKPGGFYRIRNTDPVELPISLSATKRGLIVGFAKPLDRESATSVDLYGIKAWDLTRSASYGSKHLNERSLDVRSVELLPDGKSVRIDVANLAPTRGMSIRMRIKTADGKALNCEIHNTVHVLKE
ncbi:MAG: DUF6797 domain-containing protein [Planctomycetota bacterium]